MVVLSMLEKLPQSVWYLIFEKVNYMEYAAICKHFPCCKPHIPEQFSWNSSAAAFYQKPLKSEYEKGISIADFLSYLFSYFFSFFRENTRVLWTTIYISS